MANFQTQIEAAAKVFANTVVQIVRSYSIDEVVLGRGGAPGSAPLQKAAKAAAASMEKAPAKAEKASKGGKRRGRAPKKSVDVAALAHRVVELAKKEPIGRKGLLETLKVEDSALQKALTYARNGKALKIEGEKRNARYVATGRSLA